MSAEGSVPKMFAASDNINPFPQIHASFTICGIVKTTKKKKYFENV